MEISSKQITLDDSRKATFRAVTSEDGPFIVAIYGSIRADELALTNWNQGQRDAFLKMQSDAQLSHYREYYPAGEHLVIQVDGADAGRLYIANIAEEIRILDITVLPESRNGGVGTPIIRELMDEAAGMGKPLRIWVESYNPALRLFERLGFVKSSENDYSYLMEWRPASMS